MNKEEFLKRLEQLLSDISEEERADALAFYRSYFEDAGIGNEASILEELESPEKVAEVIKKDLGVSEAADVETHEAVLAVIIRKILLMPEELMAVRMRPVRPIWRI